MTLRRLEEFRPGVRPEQLSDTLAADFFQWLLARRIRAVTVNGHRSRLFAPWRFARKRTHGRRATGAEAGRVSLMRPMPGAKPKWRRFSPAPANGLSWSRPGEVGHPGGEVLARILTSRLLDRFAALDADPAPHGGLRPGVGMAHGTGQHHQERSRQTIPARRDAVAAIRAISAPRRELLLPREAGNTRLARHMRAIIAAAGVPASTRRSSKTFHKIRRTSATITAVKRGLAAASELLGHSSIEMTRRYIDSSKLAGTDATEFLPILTSRCRTARRQPGGRLKRMTPPGSAKSTAPTQARQVFESGMSDVAAACLIRVAIEHWIRGETNQRGQACPRRPTSMTTRAGSSPKVISRSPISRTCGECCSRRRPRPTATTSAGKKSARFLRRANACSASTACGATTLPPIERTNDVYHDAHEAAAGEPPNTRRDVPTDSRRRDRTPSGQSP